MGFNLYLAGAACIEDELYELGINRLASQLNDRKLIISWLDRMREKGMRNLFIDSGAYSAHTKGKSIDVDEYIQFVNDNEGMFSVIAQVDKIPGEWRKPKTHEQLIQAPEESWQNYLYMRERVKDKDALTPIFHQGEDFKHLHRMLETTFDGRHIPYIGISPANDVGKPDKCKWFETVFSAIRKSSNPNVKTHCFGLTSFTVLEQYPFYSADATTWLMAAIYGAIFTDWGQILVGERVTELNHFNNQHPDLQKKIREQVARWGYTIEECMESGAVRKIVNASYSKWWADNYKLKSKMKFQKRLF